MNGHCGMNFNVDGNKLIGSMFGTKDRVSYNERYFDGGKGRFISYQSGGNVYALCNHKEKWHSASAENRSITGTHKASSEAPPGVWAKACVKSGNLGVDKTHYNTSDKK